MKTALSLFLFLFCLGCSGKETIRQGLNSEPYPLSYLHDSKKISEKTNINLCLNYLRDDTKDFPDTTTVKGKGGFVIPLLLLNVWNFKYQCTLGRMNLREAIPNFVRNEFLTESQRSCVYRVVENSPNCDYSLDLTIKSHTTIGPYSKHGFIYFALYAYGYSVGESAGPAVSTVAMHMRLSKNGTVVLEKDIQTEYVGRPIQSRYSSTNEMQMDYSNSMVESLSYAFKNCIEKVVKEVNSAVDSKTASVDAL